MPARIVLFSFGKDIDLAIENIRPYRPLSLPPSSRFLVARAKSSDEIWIFPLPQSRSADDRGSTYVDFEADNPTISNAVPMELKGGEDDSGMTDFGEAIRFSDIVAFRTFVDRMLVAGDVVFRACYSPKNSYFCSRKERPCKVLCCSAPLLVFDDHDEDWEVAGDASRVVKVFSPKTVERRNSEQREQGQPRDLQPTCFVTELRRFMRDFALQSPTWPFSKHSSIRSFFSCAFS